jgi:16S rRNA processing protein RimM
VLLEVGRVARPHGVRGEVVVVLTTDRNERVAPGSRLQTRGGELLVEASRPFGDRHLVRFSGVAGREQADALRGTVLFAEPIDDPDELWVHDLVGCRVVEVDGTERGEVVAVQANPASDLLVLDSGALVPLTFAVEVGPGAVTVDVPPGLFDLD